MKKSKIFIFLIILSIIFIIIFCFFSKKTYKITSLGNNMSNKSSEEIKDYILNISSYETIMDVEVMSNKNYNKYIINQKYASPNIYKQEIVEPSNIKNLKIIYDGKDLKIENTKLNLSELYENYKCITENFLYLTSFIEDYKSEQTSTYTEENNQIIMETKVSNIDSKYTTYKKLYIGKENAKPIKMEIQDINKNILVNILYNEIKINNTKGEDILAFRLNFIKSDI